MPTYVSVLPDSAFVPRGPVIKASQVHGIYGGVPGEAVFKHPGQWYQTTPQSLIDHTGSDWGRKFPGFSLDRPIGNSNDTREGEMEFHVDNKPGADRDGDGKDADTIVFSFIDVQDIPGGRKLPGGGTETSFWFNGKEFDVRSDDKPDGHLPNGDLLVLAVRTDADDIHFRYNTGHDANPDGFAMHTCIPAVDNFDFV